MAQTLISLNAQDYITATFTQNAAGAIPTLAFFVADSACKVISSKVSYATAAGGASTVGIVKDPSGTAPGAGTVIGTALDMNTTVNTTYTQTLSATPADYTLAAGDKLSIKVASGAAAGSAGVVWTVTLARV